MSVDSAVTGPATVDALERETYIAQIGQTNTCCRVVKNSEPS